MINRTTPFTGRLAVLAVATCLTATTALAGSIIYTSQYAANVLPQDSAGTITDPLWIYGSSGNATASVNNGILYGNNVTQNDPAQHWTLDNSGSTWTPDSPGITLDLTVKVTAGSDNGWWGTPGPGQIGGFNLMVGTGSTSWIVYLGTTGINVVANNASTASSVVVGSDTTVSHSDFVTYRFVILDDRLTVFRSDSETALFSDLAGGSAASSNLIFGNVTNYIRGNYELDHIGWNNGLAEFSAPIPETSTFLLLLGAFPAFVMSRRWLGRRRTAA